MTDIKNYTNERYGEVVFCNLKKELLQQVYLLTQSNNDENDENFF